MSGELGRKKGKKEGTGLTGKKGKQRLGECRKVRCCAEQGSRAGVTRREGQEGTGTTAPSGRKGSRNTRRPSTGREGRSAGGGGATHGPRARRDAGGNCGLQRGRALRRRLLGCGRPPALHSGLGAAGAGRGGGAGRRQEDKMAAADGSFSPGPPPPPPPRAGKGVSARLAQTHLAGCVEVRDPGLEASRGGWRRGGGGWRRMAPRSAPPVSLAHSAAGLRLTAHPGNRRPREHPPPPASLRGWARPLICIGGGAPSSPTPPLFRAVPSLKKIKAVCGGYLHKGEGLTDARTPVG